MLRNASKLKKVFKESVRRISRNSADMDTTVYTHSMPHATDDKSKSSANTNGESFETTTKKIKSRQSKEVSDEKEGQGQGQGRDAREHTGYDLEEEEDEKEVEMKTLIDKLTEDFNRLSNSHDILLQKMNSLEQSMRELRQTKRRGNKKFTLEKVNNISHMLCKNTLVEHIELSERFLVDASKVYKRLDANKQSQQQSYYSPHVNNVKRWVTHSNFHTFTFSS